MTTEAEDWAESWPVRWRKARKAHWCIHQRHDANYRGKRCAVGDNAEAIQPGDEYLDIGGRFDPLNPFGKTAKLCADCARRPPKFDKSPSPSDGSERRFIWGDPQ